MAPELIRSIKFRLTTELDPNAEKAFRDTEKRVADLQKSMNLTLQLEGRVNGVNGSNGSNGRNGTGSPQGGGAAARLADRAARERERAAERAFRTEAKWARMAEAAVEKRARADEQAAKRSANENAREAARVTRERQRELDRQIKADKKFWDEAIQQAQTGAKARADAIAAAERSRAAGWGRLSGLGRESFTTNRKVNSGFEALSEMGRAAMPRDPFAEGLQRMERERAARTGWAGLGRAGADTADRLEGTRALRSADALERRRQIDESTRSLREQRRELREVNGAAYDVVHAFGQMTRAATQFGLIGQRDMARVLDTIFAVEGGINAIQGVMGAGRALRGLRGGAGRADLGPAAALSAGPLARLLGAGMRFTGTRSLGGMATVGGAGVAALTAGAIGAGGTVADYRRGVGPGHVGGFWDTILSKEEGATIGTAAFLQRGAMAVERKFNEPYGTGKRESIRRQIAQLDKYIAQSQAKQGAETSPGNLGFFVNPASTNRARGQAAAVQNRLRLVEELSNLDSQARFEIRQGKEAEGSVRAPLEARLRASEYGIEAQRYAFRSAGLQARGSVQEQLRGEAFGRQQTARSEELELRQTRALGGYVSAAQEARAKRERELEEQRVGGLRGHRLRNLRTQRKEAEDRGKTLDSQYKAAKQKYESIRPDANSIEGMTNAGSATEVATAYREMQEADERLKKNAEEVLRIKQEQRTVGVEGAQEELQMREQALSAAKQLTRALRDERQTDKERFGKLLPEQQASVREAMEAATSGNANRLQIQRLEEFGFARQNVREYYEGKAGSGGFDQLYGMSGRGTELQSAEAEEKKSVGITESARDALATKLHEEASQRARENANVIVPLLERALQFEREETERLIKEGLDNVRRENNQQGGQQWGVG